MTCNYTLVSGDVLNQLVWFRAEDDGNTVGKNSLVSLVETSNGRYSLSNDKDLMISTVEVNDAGNYLCRIVTQNVQTADDYDELIVQYLDTPVVTPAQLSAKMDETAEFSTVPVGFPTPITITWIKDDVILDVSDMKKYPNSDATLTINNVNETDAGVYKCRVENAAYMGEEGKLSNTVKLITVAEFTTTSISSKSTIKGPKSEGVCNSTGLVVGMTFVGVFIGFILCLLVGFIIIRKSNPKVPTSKNTNQSGQEYMTYVEETDKETNHTYQDLQKKDDNQAVYVNVKAKKDKNNIHV
ncbi:cell adhesion molecule 1-like isoform X2 [Antedon mediterranea]|uniref:cell adhesion molecule 1-like isoform X2 n=1 Tax=Antedon mediterranea TaxID=105859 RepID=UPI003AF915E7